MGRMINPRRLRDCYASSLPPTRQQFDRYLMDLSDWISYLRHSRGAIYIRDLSDESLSQSYLPMLSPSPYTRVPHSYPMAPLYDPYGTQWYPYTNGMFFEHKTGPKTGIYFDTPVENPSSLKVCIKAYRP